MTLKRHTLVNEKELYENPKTNNQLVIQALQNPHMRSSFKIKIGELLIKGACKKQLAKWTKQIYKDHYLDEYTKFELMNR